MNSLQSLFKPSSIAVIGASGNKEKIGYSIVENIKNCGYTGAVYPVNPKEKEILGYPCYASIGEIGLPVDVAVISIPADPSLKVARECGQAGVKFLVVITAGFKEIGEVGLKREKELVEICREYNMRLVGPNVVGIMDTHSPVNASFADGFPKKGEIAFISQSGAMLLAILDWSRSKGLGFSRFVSMGNKADLNEVDFIWSAAEDPNTKVILAYLEDVTDGKRFIEVVREASLRKPVIILKSGTSSAGARAASSHTGALAGSDLAYDIAFRQCGVIRVQEMSDLFDLAISFINQPIPSGDRVAIVTNSGGPGIIATDSVERNGLRMSRFSKETIEKMRQHLPAEANLYNPVDVLGDARTDRFSVALEAVLEDEHTDNLLLLLSPTAVTEPEKTAEYLVNIRKRFTGKPIFASFTGGERLEKGARILSKAGIPCFPFPEPALKSISGMVNYTRMRQKIQRNTPLPEVSKKAKTAVKAILYDVLCDHRSVLLGNEATQIAAAYGIPAAPVYLARTPEEAIEIADALGYPIVLKVASPKIIHKSDVGGVQVGLENAARVREGYLSIMDSVSRLMPGTPVYGIEVQKMMPRGPETIIGMTRDLQFGPLLAFGLGGIYVNLLKDVSFRLAEGLNMEEIEEMITETKANTLLRGYRGSTPSDIGAIVQALARVARLSLDFPEIKEIDLNPVIAYPDSAMALDVKITASYENGKEE